ncbi:hypothetical protein A2714_02565 [Candidatus Woesebacteria bacterium RIFCSPHIGHO2_01_FULL_38_9]|uniref:Glycosyl transferase family 1 domain-containing protein n=2 Tax=Candidatus Woeseibacteriota TaxID=1752722 RepID=A0A1F7Y478_9BACT|nr:MAG: hypothetical protein A2714_02565 [Candidatus Woesebacteria bacterium RIFCSPHIGHO2_01_FULL_38_9]OGM60560.1 MAG: hypothetical protein A3A75_03485 [Candidatus Woesebacteria bacterium RIFCSPLOWO2_01_FULL_39_10]
MLSIAIDSGPLSGGHSVRGIGVMVKEQIQAIKRLSDQAIKLETFDFAANHQSLITNHYDIVHYPYFFPYALTLPSRKYGEKMVVTIQDLIQLIYPNNYPPGIRGKLNFYKQRIRLKNVDAVITISETSKKDIVRFLGIPAEKIHVIYLAPTSFYKVINDKEKLKDVRRKYNLPSKFVFYLGDVNYNKNIPTLIKACEIAGLPLAIGGKHATEVGSGEISLKAVKGPRDWIRFILGKPHPETAHFRELEKLFSNNKNIIRTGYIPDEDIAAVFNCATVCCQPSFYEGFGLSVVNSFACGVPVVIAKTQALVEIADGAALVADPNDGTDFADKISSLINNPALRGQTIKKGFERVKFFSWEKTAREMIDLYKKVTNDM